MAGSLPTSWPKYFPKCMGPWPRCGHEHCTAHPDYQHMCKVERMKYGVIYKDSYYVPGDERSRTNPGHGYPGGTEYYEKCETFDSKDKLIEWIKRNDSAYGSKKQYTAFEMKPLQVSTTVEVNIA